MYLVSRFYEPKFFFLFEYLGYIIIECQIYYVITRVDVRFLLRVLSHLAMKLLVSN